MSSESLFSSLGTFDSGPGWRSFTRPIDEANGVRKIDHSLFGSGVEVRADYPIESCEQQRRVLSSGPNGLTQA
ncbi:MAG: hypothetical protein EXR75_11570 [Myxococcales bacterium]|nr:hypothetical protein [Myxococcales bacterium]